MSGQTRATREVLSRLVEQPEPSPDGDWYVMSLDSLKTEGYTHIEIHYNDGCTRPNDVVLAKEGLLA